jgi:hypothetical protein
MADSCVLSVGTVFNKVFDMALSQVTVWEHVRLYYYRYSLHLEECLLFVTLQLELGTFCL